jgi:hypothetical protein
MSFKIGLEIKALLKGLTLNNKTISVAMAHTTGLFTLLAARRAKSATLQAINGAPAYPRIKNTKTKTIVSMIDSARKVAKNRPMLHVNAKSG